MFDSNHVLKSSIVYAYNEQTRLLDQEMNKGQSAEKIEQIGVSPSTAQQEDRFPV